MCLKDKCGYVLCESSDGKLVDETRETNFSSSRSEKKETERRRAQKRLSAVASSSCSSCNLSCQHWVFIGTAKSSRKLLGWDDLEYVMIMLAIIAVQFGPVEVVDRP